MCYQGILKPVNMCNGSFLKFYTRNKLETSDIYLTIYCLTSHRTLLYVSLLKGILKDTIKSILEG